MNQETSSLYAVQITSGSAIDKDVKHTFYLKNASDFTQLTEKYDEALRMPRYEATAAMLSLVTALEMPVHEEGRNHTIALLHKLVGCEKPYDPAYITFKVIEPLNTITETYCTLLSSTLSVMYNELASLRSFFDHDPVVLERVRKLTNRPGTGRWGK